MVISDNKIPIYRTATAPSRSAVRAAFTIYNLPTQCFVTIARCIETMRRCLSAMRRIYSRQSPVFLTLLQLDEFPILSI